MNLKVKNNKPVVFIKLQTTGLNVNVDRVIELALIKFEDGKEPISIVRRFNPNVQIPEDITAINGITNEDVSSEPFFEQKATGIAEFLKNCDFIGFDIRRIDIPFLVSEFHRSGVDFSIIGVKFIDLNTFYNKIEPRSFINAVNKFNNKKIDNQISSQNFLFESVDLFNNMLKQSSSELVGNKEDFSMLSNMFDPMCNSLDVDGKIILNEEKRPVFSFGKYKGKLLYDVFTKDDPDYFQWLLEQNFSYDTKKVISRVYQKCIANKSN